MKKNQRYSWKDKCFYEGREMVLSALKSGIFPTQPIEGTGHPGKLVSCPSDLATLLKILTLSKCFRVYQ